MVFLLRVGRLPLAISWFVSRDRILCEATLTVLPHTLSTAPTKLSLWLSAESTVTWPAEEKGSRTTRPIFKLDEIWVFRRKTNRLYPTRCAKGSSTLNSCRFSYCFLFRYFDLSLLAGSATLPANKFWVNVTIRWIVWRKEWFYRSTVLWYAFYCLRNIRNPDVIQLEAL